MVKQLTYKRVQALNEMALAGEADVIAHWAEAHGIPIDGTDDEIRASVLGSRRDVTLKTARAAAERLRRSQDARKILLSRYLPTIHATEDVTFEDLENLSSPKNLVPTKLRRGLYFYRGYHVAELARRRAGTERFRIWQVGHLEDGTFVPLNPHEQFAGRAPALDAVDEMTGNL